MKSDFKNLAQLIFYQAKNFANENALNFKKNGEWVSFSNYEFLEKSVYFASALIGQSFKPGSKLAIYSYQNPKWLIADFGAILAGGITVPIFHNVSKENLLFQLKDANINTVFADFEEDFAEKNNFDKVETLSSELPRCVRNIVCDGFEIKDSLLNNVSFEEFLQKGKKYLEKRGVKDLKELLKKDLSEIYRKLKLPAIKKSDLATIVYTSGSTGRPKGVQLSHENLVVQIEGAGQCFKFNKDDRVLSFLPLAHIFERMVMMLYISKGLSVYFVDDVNDLGVFLKEVKPTVMTVVPRVLEKVFAKIKSGSQKGGFLKKYLANAAMNEALNKNVETNNVRKGFLDRIFDKLVYKKYRDALGSEMRMMICGGAALSNEMEKFYRNIGINLYCGYGLTESSPVLAVNFPGNSKFGTVGKAFPGVELKTIGDGELLAKGKNIMLGYLNNQKETDKVIEKGWLKTGDLARIDEEGYLTITGRKKELFKTSNGKYVRPIAIEQKLVQDLGFLTGALVIAEGKNFVSVLLFPDFELLESLKKKLNFTASDLEFVSSKALRDFTDQKITVINSELDRGEQIFKFTIVKDQISIASGDITPSMKLRRSNLEKKYFREIDKMYSVG